ncbi:MAG: hypothetical protein BWY72_02300 [Bacteroidetes bacterium ADurb.Bin416]|nr:MAG: hypothetical protein BWY72_02300 [Bacteroidetes bacterium ADurb.Bin416]
MTGQPIHREAPVGSTDTAQPVFIYIRLSSQRINGRQVILHVLTVVITADLLFPGLAQTRGTTSVGDNDDVTLGGHETQVPAIGPKLTDIALRATGTIQDGRIGLGGIKIRRINHPGQHLLVVGGFDEAAFHGNRLELGHQFLVLIGQGCHGTIGRVDTVQFVGTFHGMTVGDQLVTSQRQA